VHSANEINKQTKYPLKLFAKDNLHEAMHVQNRIIPRLPHRAHIQTHSLALDPTNYNTLFEQTNATWHRQTGHTDSRQTVNIIIWTALKWMTCSNIVSTAQSDESTRTNH